MNLSDFDDFSLGLTKVFTTGTQIWFLLSVILFWLFLIYYDLRRYSGEAPALHRAHTLCNARAARICPRRQLWTTNKNPGFYLAL